MGNHNGYLPHFKDFDYNCDRHIKKKYSLAHDPRPLPLSKISPRRWNISCGTCRILIPSSPLQCHSRYRTSLRELQLHPPLNEEDILFLDYIDDDIVDYYTESICTRCQKIIITTAEEKRPKISAPPPYETPSPTVILPW